MEEFPAIRSASQSRRRTMSRKISHQALTPAAVESEDEISSSLEDTFSVGSMDQLTVSLACVSENGEVSNPSSTFTESGFFAGGQRNNDSFRYASTVKPTLLDSAETLTEVQGTVSMSSVQHHRGKLARALHFTESLDKMTVPLNKNVVMENVHTTKPATPERPQFFVRKAICILSSFPYITFFKEYLTHMYWDLSNPKTSVPIERYFAHLLYEIPVPPAGGGVHLSMDISPTKTLTLSYPSKQDFPLLDISVRPLFLALDVDTIMSMFCAVLTEKRILLCSSSNSLVTHAAEIILSLIYPFQWPHTYIPVLPAELLECVEAPTPFIMGIHRSFLERIPDSSLKELVVIDIDHNLCMTSTSLPLLPEVESRKLMSHLRRFIHPELVNFDLVKSPHAGGLASSSSMTASPFDSMRRHNFSSEEIPDLEYAAAQEEQIVTRQVRSSFLSFFFSLFKNFRKYLQTTQFDKQKYLEDSPEGSREFLDQVVDTQAFQQLIFYCMTKNTLPDLFECLLSGSRDIFQLRQPLPAPKAIITLPPSYTSPHLGSHEGKEFVPTSVIPSQIDHDLLEEFSDKMRIQKELEASITQAISMHPQVGELYLLRSSVYSRLGDFSLALSDYASCFQLDKNRFFGPSDRELLQAFYQLVDRKQLEEVASGEGPVAKLTAEFLEEQKEHERVKENEFPSICPASPGVIYAGMESNHCPFEDLREVSFPPDQLMSKSTFAKFAVTFSLAKDEEFANLIFDTLLQGEKWRQLSHGKSTVRNARISKLFYFLTDFIHEVDSSLEKRMELLKSECVVVTFSHCFTKNGDCGDVYLTTRRLIFRCTRRHSKTKGVIQTVSWAEVTNVECQDFKHVIGGLACVKIQFMRKNKRKTYQFRFWSKDERDIFFHDVRELHVGFSNSTMVSV